MGRKQRCPKCGEKLEHIYHKFLKWNIPDAERGRGLCQECGEGCVTFDVNIYHNDFEIQTYPQTDEQTYGVCCNCGKRGDRRLWLEAPPKVKKKGKPRELPSNKEMLEEYRQATPDERAFAKAFLGHDPFEEEDKEDGDV